MFTVFVFVNLLKLFKKFKQQKSTPLRSAYLLVEEDGFEPSKAEPTDLQSVPFGHSGTLPGAGGRNRTNNRLITNQLLYH